MYTYSQQLYLLYINEFEVLLVKQKRVSKKQIKLYMHNVLEPLEHSYISYYEGIESLDQKIFDFNYQFYLEKLEEFAFIMDIYRKQKKLYHFLNKKR